MISVKTVGSEFYGCSSPSFQSFPSLESLSFEDMPKWEEWNLMGGTATEFPRLSHLSLSKCPELKGSLPSNLPSLTTLDLYGCSQLKSLSSGEADDGNMMRHSNLFRESMLGLNSLQELSTDCIPSLMAFPRDGLPKTLRSLQIINCENLEFPTHESLRSYKALETLSISSSCCSLTSFPLGSLPVLKWVELVGYKNLKSISIPEEEDAPQCLTFLQSIFIERCHELESFPLLGLTIPNLKHFKVWFCNKLNSLPEPINKLTGLQELKICGLPNLQSFAEEGLPISLQKLRVHFREQIFSNMDITNWGLERLTSLAELEIGGGDHFIKMLMEMEEPLLPSSLVSLGLCADSYREYEIKHLEGKWLQHLTSLKSLNISSFYNLESLPEGLPSSLESLQISFCGNLKSLPEGLPSSLESLKISCCDNLESLPAEGLPSSLSELTIRDCPSLKASCQSNGGKEWPKIAHIPCIIIDREHIN